MLKVIDKYPGGEARPNIRIRYKLTAQEEKLFTLFYIKQVTLNTGDMAHLQKLSKWIYEQEKWIQCGCTAHLEKPLMRLKRSQAGKLFLARITRTGHHAECPYKEIAKKEHEHLKTKSRSGCLKKDGPLNLIARNVSGITVSNKKSSAYERSSPSRRRPTLCNSLYRIIEEAGLNTISLTQESSPYNRLVNTVAKLEVVSSIPLSDYFHLNATKKGLYDAAMALKHDQRVWPNAFSRHCVFLAKAKSFNNNQIEVYKGRSEETQCIDISNQVIPSSGRLGSRSEPYMAMIVVKDSVLNPGFYVPTDAFIVPCYSKTTFIPVDSHYERLVLKKMFSLQFYLKERGVFFEIVKPLFDIEVTKEEETHHVLPDFIIKTPAENIVIEVSGSHETEYLSRKERTHEHMKQIGTLLNIDCYGAELNNRLDEELSELTRKIKHILS